MTKQKIRKPILKLLWSAGAWLGPIFERRPQHGKIDNILVFQGGGIGDVVRLFPAVLALRAAFPNANIVTLTQFGNVLFRYLPSSGSNLQHIIFDLHGEHKTFFGKIRLAIAMRKRRFDLIFSPNYGLGMIEAMILAYLMRAPHRIGYDSRGSGFLFTAKKTIAEDQCLQDQHLALLSGWGVDVGGKKEPYFRLPGEDEERVRTLLKHHGVADGDRIVSIAPEVKSDDPHQSFPECRTWPPERYEELVREMIHRYGTQRLAIVVLGTRETLAAANGADRGPAKKNDLCRRIDLSGKTTLMEAVGLVARSDLFVGNDSGLLHIAVAAGTPAVGIFGATSPRQVIPLGDEIIAVRKEIPCAPCYFHGPLLDFSCTLGGLCLRTVSVPDVIEAVDKLLRSGCVAREWPQDRFH